MKHSVLIAGPAAGPLRGDLTPPGDKSMSHRAVMLAALADGISEIHGFLPGEDNLSTAQMFVQMGVRIDWLNSEKTSLRIHGVGLHGLREAEKVLDAGNAGTCARLMMGVLAGQSFTSTLTGDASLRSRPMQRVSEPVQRMGAVVKGSDNGKHLPITIRGGNLHGIDYVSPVASAQIKSCVLLAGLFADGETTIREPRPSRDHTERMLPLFAQSVNIDDDGTIRLQPQQRLIAPDAPILIPADPSSAAFFAVAASLVADSELLIHGIGINPRRDGWRHILADMQADIRLLDEICVGDEPVADFAIRSAQLYGMQVNPANVPDAIDEFPVLFVAAALADGTFLLQGAGELRVKESDRISVMANALNACGAHIEERPDGIRINGCNTLQGGVEIDAKGDHRIAMAMAVAAQRADSDIRIRNAAAIATSFPDFVSIAQRIGMNVRWEAG
ncbi:MAG: 3-phosphoshikimate 1-carboxyvinyltransferase [Mariprofundaceae bacterium]|nr:3-phosphoshikimate 1-carboxyvinyltransferase [Mariprofundaceae bacterium]